MLPGWNDSGIILYFCPHCASEYFEPNYGILHKQTTRLLPQ